MSHLFSHAPLPYLPAKQPPDVFLEDQLERAEHKLLSPGDPTLPPALRDLPEDWRGVLAAYRAAGAAPTGGGGGGGGTAEGADVGGRRYVLSVRHDPFQVDLYAGDELAVSANRR